MRAWMLERPALVAEGEPGPLTLAEMARPQPGPGEVRLHVAACGVCHTDLHTAEGELALPRLPIVPGHQVVGTVYAVGPGVPASVLGRRLGAFWLRKACGTCAACLRGDENLCERAEFNGLHGHGGYAEWMTVPLAYTVAIPDRMTSQAAAPLLCAGVIGYRALRLSDFTPGRSVALFGFGASAHLVLQLAARQDARVFVFTRGQSHRRLALQLGAAWAGAPGEEAPELADSAVTFAPAGEVVPQALAAVRPGGTVAVNAVHMSDIPAMPYALLYGERTLRSVANLTAQDARDFIALADRLDIRAEYQTYDFADANAALRDMKASRVDGAAVLDVAAAHGAAQSGS
jgi:propanol-preferring alcohol dehydrogenase